MAGFPKTFLLSFINTVCSPNPGTHALRFGLFPVRSPLLRKSLVIFSSSGYLDVSVPRVPPIWLWIHHTVAGVCPAGFPHSEIDGSMDMCSSPSLIAAYHVFHRLLVPRHPPCALVRLTFCHAYVAHRRLWFTVLSWFSILFAIIAKNRFGKIEKFYYVICSFQRARELAVSNGRCVASAAHSRFTWA